MKGYEHPFEMDPTSYFSEEPLQGSERNATSAQAKSSLAMRSTGCASQKERRSFLKSEMMPDGDQINAPEAVAEGSKGTRLLPGREYA